jgi:hypothetical protein
MDADIYALAGKYGFKGVHTRLVEIMRQEYEFMSTMFEKAHMSKPEAIPEPKPEPVKKTPRKKGLKPMPVAQNEIVNLSVSEEGTVEVKDVIVTLAEKSDKGFRDPKEMREFQRAGEEAKRKENEAAGIQLLQVLTKENLKKWIEDEGNTYAWVAREKAGCPDTQVAATAQMMGIKSKISKKRGMIIRGK